MCLVSRPYIHYELRCLYGRFSILGLLSYGNWRPRPSESSRSLDPLPDQTDLLHESLRPRDFLWAQVPLGRPARVPVLGLKVIEGHIRAIYSLVGSIMA